MSFKSLGKKSHDNFCHLEKTRPDTRLSQSRTGKQGAIFEISEAFGQEWYSLNFINAKKVKRDRRMDGRPDGPTKRGVESRSTRLKIV